MQKLELALSFLYDAARLRAAHIEHRQVALLNAQTVPHEVLLLERLLLLALLLSIFAPLSPHFTEMRVRRVLAVTSLLACNVLLTSRMLQSLLLLRSRKRVLSECLRLGENEPSLMVLPRCAHSALALSDLPRLLYLVLVSLTLSHLCLLPVLFFADASKFSAL